MITFNGVTQCLSAWAEQIGIKGSTLSERLKWMPIERALTMKRRKFTRGKN